MDAIVEIWEAGYRAGGRRAGSEGDCPHPNRGHGARYRIAWMEGFREGRQAARDGRADAAQPDGRWGRLAQFEDTIEEAAE